METVEQISSVPWMDAEETQKVMRALNDDAENPAALFVGGCVRDAVLGKETNDIDIATRHLPDEVIKILSGAGIKTIPTGIDHGTVTAVSGEKSFEITTLRRDIETYGRHAAVAFSESWREDAGRRDFTMNTLLADEKGCIFDPTGQGLEDLKQGRVLFVGDPATRIAEDYLRILRFFRFHVFYGEGEPDARALQACRDAAPHLDDLSGERITQEFLKIMSADNAVDILRVMFENNILDDVVNQNYDPRILARLVSLQQKNELPDVMTRLAVLTNSLERLESRLVLSNAQKKSFSMTFRILNENSDEKDQAVKKLIYKYGAGYAWQALLFCAARHDKELDLTPLKDWKPPEFPVKGEDIIQAGVPPGPEVGDVLARIEKWWLERDMVPDRDSCLHKAGDWLPKR